MLTPIAFLQTGADAIACVQGPLGAVDRPSAGSAAFFAPDFILSTRSPWWFDAEGLALRTWSRAEWAEHFSAVPRSGVAPAWCEPDQRRFASSFRSLRRQLDAGTLRKGVPVTSTVAALSDREADSLFLALLGRVPLLPPGVFAYGFYFPPGMAGQQGPEFMIGATPEILFELEDRRSLTTAAVAGTRPSADVPADLEGDPKERDEHQAVVEDLLAQLSVWGETTASVTTVRPFGQLAHLVADIRLDARHPLDFETVARRLHPTPALGVYPRGAAGDAWLAEVDPRGDRRRFGAPFGLRLPSGGGRCVVAIRSLQYAAGRLEIWAGCGVVPLSRYDDEWKEVLQKIQTVRALWGV
jgi:menaquinone-specific isochorismate synthase